MEIEEKLIIAKLLDKIKTSIEQFLSNELEQGNEGKIIK